MTERVRLVVDGPIATIEIDNPPVNALDLTMAQELERRLGDAEGSAAVRAIVIAGAGRTFVAGADIKALERAAWGDPASAPDLHDLLCRIEDCAKPVVMALHGTVLGGGLELAMAGHYRVAARGARLGQPEVSLGIIPGAEGTQRLPRLVGVQKAIEMCVSGKPVTADEAHASGLVDLVVDGDLRGEAGRFAQAVSLRAEGHPKTRERGEKLGSVESAAPLLAAGRELAGKSRLEAARAAVEAIAAAVALPFLEGCRREREIFFERVASEQAKALLHVFLAEREVAHVPGVAKEAPSAPISKVGIVGAGTMGGGIAMACADAGLSVTLTDASAAALDAGLARVRRNYETSVKRGRLTRDEAEERLARIHPQTDHAGLEAAELLIEAVFESFDLKRQVFAELDAIARPGAVLATNTSTLDVDALAEATSRPEHVIGLHFFSPANVMRLVEVVRGRRTSPALVRTALDFAKRLRKVGVVVGNGPGFVGNRLMFPYMYETQFLVEDGATPEQVDRVLTQWGMAMGMFAVDDMAGRDVGRRVRQELGHFADSELRRPLVAEKLDARGWFGQKSGRGWYRYEDGRTPLPDREVLAIIEETAREAGIERRPVTDAEILERSLYALVNEGARVLEQGLALRASDIDVIYVNGYGFPAWRGGPMFWADRVGLRTIHERVKSFEQAFGKRWAPAPLLRRLAERDSTFRERDAGRAETGGLSDAA